MTYIDDTTLELKCDPDALYHGDIPTEAVGIEDIEIEDSPATSSELFLQQFPAGVSGWETA